MPIADDATEPLRLRADEILKEALDLPRSERPAYLDRACGGDAELRTLVERLIRNCEDESFLTPGGGMMGPLFDGLVEELEEEHKPSPEGTLVGSYRIVRELGRGGMAVVYLAQRADGQFEQQVALKLLRRGFDSGETLQRFDRERQILALAHHPNIAQLLDGGVDPEGRPFFAMEYVEGRPIDRYCDEARLGLRQRLGLFLQVARAVDYAHRNLVVHRDIKPSNILVTAGSEAGGQGVGHVKLLDFGIAKLLDSAPGAAALTRSHAQVMTPLYASPEQIHGEAVTTASDVYQLGLLLYLLLTGRWPYRVGEAHAGAVVRAICHDEPTRPSTAVEAQGPSLTGEEPQTPEAIGDARRSSPARLKRQLSGDLDNILLTALCKEPERRYGSVAQLIADVENFLADRPVTARADTFLYRAGKLVRRHKASVVTALAAAVLLAGLAVFHTVQLARERDRAQLAAARATQVSDFLGGLFAVSAPTRSKGEQITARQLLDRGAGRIEDELADQPELQAAMMTLMGNVYRELALYEEAEPLLERAAAVRRERPGPRRLELAGSLHALARVREEQGGHAAAAALYGEALGIREAALGPRHPEVARTLNGLGRTLALQGDFEAAEGHHRRALGILEDALGPEDPEVGRTLTSLGAVLARVREFEEARGLLERALGMLERSYEPDHPHVAHTKIFLANALRFTGDTAGARAQYESALPRLERAYGPDHPEVASALTRLGNLLNSIGEPEAAIERHRRALEIRRQALGAGHALVASSLNNLGLAVWRKGDLGSAEGYFEDSIRIWEAALGPDHVDVAIALRNLAEVLEQSGELAAAVPLYERVLEIRQRVYGPDHSLLSPPLYQLGMVRLQMGDPVAAEPLLRRALAVGRDRDPYRRREVLLPRIGLGRCLVALERYAEAEELLLANVGEDEVDPETRRKTREALADLYEAWGRPREAARERRALAELASGS